MRDAPRDYEAEPHEPCRCQMFRVLPFWCTARLRPVPDVNDHSHHCPPTPTGSGSLWLCALSGKVYFVAIVCVFTQPISPRIIVEPRTHAKAPFGTIFFTRCRPVVIACVFLHIHFHFEWLILEFVFGAILPPRVCRKLSQLCELSSF